MSNIISRKVEVSSLYIAEITGKDHKHVLRDIKTQLDQIYGENGASKFEATYTHPQNKQEYKCYKLPKTEALLVVSGYDANIRFKIIKRLEELEQNLKQQQSIPNPKNFTMQAIAQMANSFIEMEQNLTQNFTNGINEVKDDLQELKDTSALDSVGCHRYIKTVHAKVEELVHRFPNVSKGSLYAQIHGAVKEKYEVASYKDLPKYKLDEVLKTVNEIQVSIKVA